MSSHHSHSHEHSAHGHAHPPKKRGPNGWFVAAIFLMLIGMLVYILSMDEAVQPLDGAPLDIPAAAPIDAAP